MINKYVRLLYKDEKEDAYAELVAALWEAICNIEHYDNDGQVTNYLIRALRNKFFEMYRISKRFHDNMSSIDPTDLSQIESFCNEYDDLIILNALWKVRNKFTGKKRKILDLIFNEGYSDMEVATELGISRQYVIV